MKPIDAFLTFLAANLTHFRLKIRSSSAQPRLPYAVTPENGEIKLDFLFIGALGLFFASAWGLIVLCERLMEERA